MSGSWQEAIGSDEFSLQSVIGGVRGVLEALLPGVVFVVTFIVTGSLGWTVGLSAAVSVIFVALRLLQRSSALQAVSGLLGIAIGLVWALASGRAENYYAWGIFVNAAYGLGLLLSVVIRQPLVAWGAQFLWSMPKGWMRDSTYKTLYGRCVYATWVWVGVFAIRLVVTVPLYLSGAVVALGVAKIALGLPLFAVAAALTWLLLRNMRPEIEEDDDDDEEAALPEVDAAEAQ